MSDPVTVQQLPPDEYDLTLFVACYNEEQNIIDTLNELLAALESAAFRWEILIIDDCSTDRSVEVIKAYLMAHPTLPIRLHVNEKNKGLGHNFIDAAFLGRGTYYRLICGDNVEPKETFVKVFQQIGTADLVIFYQDNKHRPWLRRKISRTFTGIINLLSGYKLKYYNGLALLKRYHVMRWHGNYRGFGFQADLITRLLDEGFRYKEVEVQASDRKTGESKALTIRNFLSVAHTLLDLFIRRIGSIMFYRRRP